MATYKPTRTFTGSTESVDAEGTATIDQINNDQDEQNIMFDPNDEHEDGTPGGIDKGNLKTGGDGSGIYTDESTPTVDPTLTGGANQGTILQLLSWIARQIKAIAGITNWWDTITSLTINIIGNVTGNLTGTASEATHAASADSADLAEAAKGDERFWFCGGSPDNLPVTTGVQQVQLYRVAVPANKKLVLKRVRFNLSASSGLRLKVHAFESTDYHGDVTPELTLVSTPQASYMIAVSVFMSTGTGTLNYQSSWWLELALENI